MTEQLSKSQKRRRRRKAKRDAARREAQQNPPVMTYAVINCEYITRPDGGAWELGQEVEATEFEKHGVSIDRLFQNGVLEERGFVIEGQVLRRPSVEPRRGYEGQI